jgi:hypothetical protein
MRPDITTAEFHAFLLAAPSVSDLRLILSFTGALEQLRTVLQLADVLPRLKTLRISYRSTKEESFQPLLDTLRSRSEVVQGRATLKAFYITSSKVAVIPSAVKTELLVFRNQAMHIRVE